jgi:hypothetical protein
VGMETNTTTKLSQKTLRAIATYGRDKCELAYHMCENVGEGANTISQVVLGGKWAGKTRSADAAIDAGREMFHAR